MKKTAVPSVVVAMILLAVADRVELGRTAIGSPLAANLSEQ